MNELRRVIRYILTEENRKALNSDKLWVQMEEEVPKQLEKLGGEISHFETDVMNNIKFVGEWYFDGIEREKMLALRSHFDEYLQRRGWNMLKYKVENTFYSDGGRLIIQCDMQPNPKSKNLYFSMQNLADEEMLLLHITPSKNVKGITSGGFKPSRVSSDGITFGGQRNFFFLIEKRDWESSIEEILTWFSVAFRGKGREDYIGDSDEELSLIVTDPWHLCNRKKRANFYVDTEFGYGTGGIDTRGFEWQMKAVYTPTHFVPIVPEVHTIW